VPPSPQGEPGAGEFRNLNYRNTPTPEDAFVLFMQQNPVQRALRSGVIFPISEGTPCPSVRPQAARFCADGLGWPFSNGVGLENCRSTVDLSTLKVLLSIGTVGRYCCFFTYGSSDQPTRVPSPPQQALDRPGVPTTMAHVVHPAAFLEILSHFCRAPCGLDPRSNPELLSSLVKQKQMECWPNKTAASKA
jgi:hypothetical protein